MVAAGVGSLALDTLTSQRSGKFDHAQLTIAHRISRERVPASI
jgi:hypothetical protein